MKKEADMLRRRIMCLVTSIFVVLICYATTISAAPPITTTPYLIPLLPISQFNNHTIRFSNITAGLPLPDSCDTADRYHRFNMDVRGTRTSLSIIICLNIPMDGDAIQDTLISAINSFDARLAAHGDDLIDPDPWYASIVEGRNCGIAVKSGDQQRTIKYQVGLDALMGLFKFYHTSKLYKSTMTIVNDKNLPEPQWDVGTIVVGPIDI